MFIGAPILLLMGLAFPSIGLYLLRRGAHLSSGVKLDAALFSIMGLCLLWLFYMILRTWYAFLTVYEVSEEGITASFFSSEDFLPWNQLSAARYRQLLGQLELRFNSFHRLVVLNNVDMNRRRTTLLAGLRMIEQVSGVTVRRTIA